MSATTARRSHGDTAAADWLADNERWLSERIGALTSSLGDGDAGSLTEGATTIRARMAHPPALERLSELVHLTAFETDLLTLLCGMELDPWTAERVGSLQGHAHVASPSLAFAMEHLCEGHVTALSPGAPLRRLRMVEVSSAASLVSAPLRLDERVLHHLLGVDDLDERLTPYVRHLTVTGPVVASHHHAAQSVAGHWSDGMAPVQVTGPSRGDRLLVLDAAAGDHPAMRLTAEDLPSEPTTRSGLSRLWLREWVFRPAMLVVEINDDTSKDMVDRAVDFATAAPGAVLSAPYPVHVATPTIDVHVTPPTPAERWEVVADTINVGSPDAPPPAVAQFALPTNRLVVAAMQASRQPGPLGDALWAAARGQARARIEGLAQRIEAVATWDDLVLPDAVAATLRGIRDHVEHQALVYDDWGWRARSSRGLGVTAMFSGPSGTGKTMAAEVLANDLRLDLYKVDLSSVVSKYIGETEKNLRRLFDAAEVGGSILLFDEADALFGRRTEVKDSHDRYANIEVSYLLQRMEAYRGLAILTTNLRDAIDQAFLRRIRFVVRFPFPDLDDRTRLWQSIWPNDVPLGELDIDRLARLGLPGGNIRNIALDASFRAAAMNTGEDPVVDMNALVTAVRAEARKTGTPLLASDWGGSS